MRYLVLMILVALASPSFANSTRTKLVEPGVSQPHLDAKGFVDDLSWQISVIIGDGGVSDVEKIQRLRVLFARDFDIETISRITLGRHWHRATERQRKEYVNAFEAYMVNTYASRLVGLSALQMKVADSRVLSRKDVLITSTVVRPASQQGLRIGWRVRRKDERFQVVDVVIDGISMAITQRAEFGSLIRTKAGKLDALVSILRNKRAAY